MPAKRKIPAELLGEVRAVYAALAGRPVERDCQLRTECCHFRVTGRTPQLTAGEAVVVAASLRSTGRKSLPASVDGACPLLDPVSKRCLVYDGRPFGCRTHFCKAAGGMLSRNSVIDLIRRLEVVDEKLGGVGPRELPSAVADALLAW